ncbi:MAG: hypothetical protein ACNS61_03420 [Candidatus Wenzhouxiangella sp. M2_3B_020]
MDFPHSKRESKTHGYSPGNGITPTLMSRAPLASEGEATPGPDDWNPYDEREEREFREQFESRESPTEGDDPFAFDDIGGEIMAADAPGIGGEPTFNMDVEF